MPALAQQTNAVRAPDMQRLARTASNVCEPAPQGWDPTPLGPPRRGPRRLERAARRDAAGVERQCARENAKRTLGEGKPRSRRTAPGACKQLWPQRAGAPLLPGFSMNICLLLLLLIIICIRPAGSGAAGRDRRGAALGGRGEVARDRRGAGQPPTWRGAGLEFHPD